MSWWNSAASWASSAYSGSGGGSSNIWGGIMSGLGSAAGAYLSNKGKDKDTKASLEAIGLQGLEQRRSLQYGAALEDFYKQKDKQRRRASLDSYGRYNLMGDIMPTTTPPVDVPTAPTL